MLQVEDEAVRRRGPTRSVVTGNYPDDQALNKFSSRKHRNIQSRLDSHDISYTLD